MAPDGGDTDGTAGPRGPFGQSVGFALSELGYLVARRLHRSLADTGIEPRHFTLMRVIEENDAPPQSAVGERLHIPPSTMVTLVDQLESRGLVERRSHPSDRRARVLYLTASGRDLLDRAVSIAVPFERSLCAGLTAEECDVLLGLLGRVGANLGAHPGTHPLSSAREDGHRGSRDPGAEEAFGDLASKPGRGLP